MIIIVHSIVYTKFVHKSDLRLFPASYVPALTHTLPLDLLLGASLNVATNS